MNETPVTSLAYIDQDWVLEEVAPAATEPAWDTSSTTPHVGSLFSKFGTYILPLAIAASIGGPAMDQRMRFVYSLGARSGSRLGDVHRLLDGWSYTVEPADTAEVRRLNALLALTVPEGLVLDLPE